MRADEILFIGYMELTATDGCLFWESFSTRIERMCEEYDGYMRYKYRDYERSTNHVQETIEKIM